MHLSQLLSQTGSHILRLMQDGANSANGLHLVLQFGREDITTRPFLLHQAPTTRQAPTTPARKKAMANTRRVLPVPRKFPAGRGARMMKSPKDETWRNEFSACTKKNHGKTTSELRARNYGQNNVSRPAALTSREGFEARKPLYMEG
ncbi:hypothetical protein LIER_29226 [Lithospermum erythrorhizon]|uniref:Uncharacterized protein n=1 Tax=Lithospermum erythrorhizon TaxID=34254 RepID=A0AAV3RPD2_LITER